MLLFKIIFILAISTKVQCAIPASYEIGTTLSAISLALAIPHYFIFNTHLRILDYLQLAYLFSLVTTLPAFSNNLSATWLKFIPNFYEKFCDSDGFVCNSGYALSSGTVIIGIIILALAITGIEKCRKPTIRFMPVFTLFKGLIRWIYISLASLSVLFIWKYATGVVGNMLTNLVAPIVVLIICGSFPWIQCLAAKCSQDPETDDIKAKWVELLALFRLMIVGMLVQAQASLSINYVFIGTYIMLVGYAVGYSLLYKFSNIPERVLVGVEQAILVVLFSIFSFKPEFISDYTLDFYMVAIIFILELIYEIYKWVIFYREMKNVVEVAPQDATTRGRNILPVNSFADNTLDDIELSVMKSQTKLRDDTGRTRDSPPPKRR